MRLRREQEMRKLKQEQEEEEKRRQLEIEQLEMEQENQGPPTAPVPFPRKRKPQPRPRSVPVETLQPHPLPPVPRPRSKLLEVTNTFDLHATPFDNDLENGTVLHMNAQEKAEAKQRWNKRCNTVRWFRETQARKVVRNGAFPNWFHGMITRRQAEDLMTDKPLGCFLIRVSESREGYTLTFRGKDRCRHYMIEMQTNGKYVILGEARAHPSLLDLIEYHKKVGIIPFMELLTAPCGQRSNEEPDYEELKNLLLIPSSLAAGEDSEPPVRLELLKLFAPPDQNQTLERQVPPVLKKISEKKLKTEAKETQRNCSEDHEESSNRRHFPRLYPSIRLAMREIQQVQQICPVKRVESAEALVNDREPVGEKEMEVQSETLRAGNPWADP
ncbi:HSH2D protein, partial [Polyodon spathula]|nr:HSH2D protein [Polyodon spathula]